MHFHSLNWMMEFGCEEWLSSCITIDLDCVIADCAGQDVANWTEDRERVFTEQESGAVSIS
jgi:hypothetical protein